jgi:hypothetical protein
MPFGASSFARRTSSLKYVLPPSMIASPRPSRAPSSRTVLSVMSPAGTMHHAVFGDSSFATNSSSDAAPVAPSATSFWTAA